MEKSTEHPNYTTGANNASFFDTSKKAQLLFRLQTFDEHGCPKTAQINTKAQTASGFNTVNCHNNFVIYWPLCYGNPIYANTNDFKRLLQGVIKKLKWPKPYKVHFIFVDTGELHRHNLAKESLTPVSSLTQLKANASTPQPTSKGDSKTNSDSPREIPVTQLNERTRRTGINLGKLMTRSLNFSKIAEELDCIIDLITWGEVKDPLAFRALIKRIVKNDSDDPENLTSLWEGNDIHNLSLFVAKQYSDIEGDEETLSPTFTQAMSPILLAQTEKDAQKYGEKFNFKRSYKATKLYLFEEKSHMMLVDISISDLVDAVFQPERLPITKSSCNSRKDCIGEKLNEWTVKLLAKRLECEISDLPKPCRYVTVQIPRNFNIHVEDALSPQQKVDPMCSPQISHTSLTGPNSSPVYLQRQKCSSNFQSLEAPSNWSLGLETKESDDSMWVANLKYK